MPIRHKESQKNRKLINFLKNIGKPAEGYKRIYGISVKSGFMSSTTKIGGEHPTFKDESKAIEYIKELNRNGIEAHIFPFDVSDKDYQYLEERGILR